MTAKSITTLVALLAGSIGLAQSPAPATLPVPQVVSTTPAECLKEIRDYQAAKQNDARAALPAATTQEERIAQTRSLVPVVQQILQNATAMAKTCAAKFDVATVPVADLGALAELAAMANLPDLGKKAIERAVSVPSLPEAERASVLVQAVSFGLREPKGDARNARIETYVDELDRMSDAVIEPKYSVHRLMNGFYRADDIDDGIIKHSTWLINTTKAVSPELRKKYGYTTLSAYINMAEAWAGQGKNDEALDLLRRAPKELPELPDAARSIEPVLARYLLVGTPAAPISASRWLNPAGSATTLEMKGHVTLLEFTAHWCGPCKESYPGIKRMLATYGPRGFRVVFSTELYGYFGTERSLTAEAEFERDRDYFAHEGLAVPIAVSDREPSKVDPNFAAYKVGGIPQIQLIDKQGRIRLIMVGYDDANEPKLAKLIESLLNER